MSVFKRGNVWWVEFWFAGRRIQESTKTSRKTIAAEYERRRRLDLERAHAGLPVEPVSHRTRTVEDFIAEYLRDYPQGRRPKSIAWANERLAHPKRLLGGVRLPDLTEIAVRGYIRTRLAELEEFRRKRQGNAGVPVLLNQETVSGRTINMEVSMLARAIGRTRSDLWPKIKTLEERKDTGRALTDEEERRLLHAASDSRSPTIVTFVRALLLTAMRCGELSNLTWHQVSFQERAVTVGRAKTSSGTGRVIPMNNELYLLLKHHAEWFESQFGERHPDLFLFPFGMSKPKDPTRPTLSCKKAWGEARKRSGVNCRIHDLRHTAITRLAETGVSDATLMAIVGHMSRGMLEHYSHIRMQAKRVAMDALSTPAMALPQNRPTTEVPTLSEYARSRHIVS